MATTTYDLIVDALQMNGTLGEGETPSSETAKDCLAALNMMLDAWSIEKLAVNATQKQSFTWPGATASRTIGPTGDFVGVRPVSVDDSTYFSDSSGNDYKVTQISESEYNDISSKTSTSSDPAYMFVNMTAPDATLTVYPVPSSSLTLNIVSVKELTQSAGLTTVLAFPPGYLRAFKFNLAVEIAAMDGGEPFPTVARIAVTSKKSIKRLNTSKVDMRVRLPGVVVGTGGSSNIEQGY